MVPLWCSNDHALTVPDGLVPCPLATCVPEVAGTTPLLSIDPEGITAKPVDTIKTDSNHVRSKEDVTHRLLGRDM